MSELKDVSGGEWRSSEETFYSDGGFSRADIYFVGNVNGAIAHVYAKSEEEALANARLMAAAKDMAEALKRGLRVFDVLEGQLNDERAAVEGFRDALKKAGAA